MKKLIVAAVMALGVFNASAQSKIGYISTDELIGIMPEAEKADNELKAYQAELAQNGQDLMKDLSNRDSLFVKDSAKLSASMKEIKRKELITLYQRVQNWQNEAQEMYNQEAQKKIAPIRLKAMDAIKAVAKENGYSYVLDINSVIVAPPGDDLLKLVMKKLNIKEPVATPAAGAPRN
ncbi:MAG: OmpH family outer membrane protein [Chitinophagaceae bacterium]|nr:MAG: OmpH family outer membrane protein [Chitinophagaceae bacterium]